VLSNTVTISAVIPKMILAHPERRIWTLRSAIEQKLFLCNTGTITRKHQKRSSLDLTPKDPFGFHNLLSAHRTSRDFLATRETGGQMAAGQHHTVDGLVEADFT
jgi:hypothetical protein